MKRDNKQTNKEGQIIAMIIFLFCFFALWTNCYGQTIESGTITKEELGGQGVPIFYEVVKYKKERPVYVSITAGTATDHQADTAVLTVGGDVRYQPGLLGARVGFNVTDGLWHTFDSYSANLTIEPLPALHFLAGWRYDNSRGWEENRHGPNVGVGLTIPIQGGVRVKIEGNHTFNEKNITNIVFGLQLRFVPAKNRTKRFF